MKEGYIRYRRLILLIAIFGVSALGLLAQIASVQIGQHDYYTAMAMREHWGKKEVLAHRGAIRDANGNPLAETTTAYDIYLIPGSIKSQDTLSKTAKTVSTLLQIPEGKFIAIHSQSAKDRTLLKSDVPFDVGSKLMETGLAGIEGEQAVRRIYPEGNLASNLLGLVGKDQKGLMGTESYYNGDLAGKSGEVTFERDSVGNEIPLGFRERVAPQGGSDLFLTIDRYIQSITEKELDQAMQKHQPKGATIIVMDPKTGAILAMANRPSFDITHPDLANPAQLDLLRNRAVSDLYEPGSTFKIITMASALQEHKVTPETTMNDPGYVIKYGWTITNWDGKGNGLVDMTEVLQYSINVGVVWVSDLLGADSFYKYIKAFGFGQPANVDLLGEAPGQYRMPGDSNWSPLDLATNSFGQAINVTPLQMITAVSAVANGGKLMRPYVVDKIVGPNGVRAFRPVEVRQVLTPETAKTLQGMLKKVVENGLTSLAMIPGYDIAGKTGTAQAPGIGGYSGRTIASFVGFGPIENPRFIIFIKVDEPKDDPWGSTVASPMFKSLVQQILVYLRVPPTNAKLVATGAKK
ncbi:MAG: penicillin-binding protein 2 [Dehalococcoidia bacterium]|nr:penicillin-binding protein 2 [Dehalococcoidia bacterium]